MPKTTKTSIVNSQCLEILYLIFNYCKNWRLESLSQQIFKSLIKNFHDKLGQYRYYYKIKISYYKYISFSFVKTLNIHKNPHHINLLHFAYFCLIYQSIETFSVLKDIFFSINLFVLDVIINHSNLLEKVFSFSYSKIYLFTFKYRCYGLFINVNYEKSKVSFFL